MVLNVEMLDSLFTRFFSAVLTVIVPAVQLWDSAKKRLLRAKKDELAVGRLGRPYLLGFRVPSWLTVLALAAIIMLALAALVGGIVVNRTGDQKAYASLHQSGWAIPVILFENALFILLAYLILAVIVYFDVPLRLALALTVGWKHQPGWISAHRVLSENGPLNVDLNACKHTANTIFEAMSDGSFQYEQDRATVPVGLSPDELANCLLVGCAIESEVHDLKKKLEFNRLYSTLALIAKGDRRPFRPEVISGSDQTQFYSLLRSLQAPNVDVLPDDASIHLAVNGLVQQLSSNYKSSTLKFAHFVVPIGTGSLSRADKRLQAFSPFAGENKESMRQLFLKLAVRWQIWPGIKPGPFIFGFSRRIAALLLNLRCILVRREDDAIDTDEDFRHLVAETEMQIVTQLKVFIDSGSDARIKNLCEARFGCTPSAVPIWRLSDEVDYFFFNQSRMADGGRFGVEATKPWRLDGNGFTRKKAD